MNRNIRFRFWDNFDKKMYMVRSLGTDGATYSVCSVARSDNHNEIDNNFAIRPIANGTLMQYTGLKDKNGKEIYEGDIVLRLSNSSIGEVKYIEKHRIGQGLFCVVGENGSRHTRFGFDEFEVIGNIFEEIEKKANHPITSIFK